MQTKSFFGPNGLSSTSANHVANLAKEASRNAQRYLDNLCFFDTYVSSFNSTVETLEHKGVDTVNSVPNALRCISENNQLIAFLREAIKEKERLADEAKRYVDQEREDDIASREDALVRPVLGDMLTAEDIMQTWSTGKLEQYLSLQADCAVLGKAIHEDGTVSTARIKAMDVDAKPVDICKYDTALLIRSYRRTVAQSDVDSLYDGLQKQFRQKQAELNGMKKELSDAVQVAEFEVREKYAQEMRDYDAARKALAVERKQFDNEMAVERNRRLQEVQALKIVIPNRLRNLYEALTAPVE